MVPTKDRQVAILTNVTDVHRPISVGIAVKLFLVAVKLTSGVGLSAMAGIAENLFCEMVTWVSAESRPISEGKVPVS